MTIIDDILRRDTDPPLPPKAYRAWLNSLNLGQMNDYYALVKLEHPKPLIPTP